MKTISMNTGNSKANESNKFIYQFTDELYLTNPSNKNIDWSIQVFITRAKTFNQSITTTN